MVIDRALSRWRMLSVLMRLVVVNAAVWILLRVAVIVATLAGASGAELQVLSCVQMPSWIGGLALRPWTVLTYMFAQYDVFHLLFNMLMLYWFGMIFQNLMSGRRLMILYLLGGLAGAGLYLLAYNLLPAFSSVHSTLIGASAATMCIVVATAMTVPDFRLNMLFIGPVKIKWIAVVILAIDLLGVGGSANVGGHISHLGGAMMGLAYGLMRRRGVDLTSRVNNLHSRIVSMFSRSKKSHSPKSSKVSNRQSDRQALDTILDKIKKSGYASLTPEERARLFDVSNRIK